KALSTLCIERASARCNRPTSFPEGFHYPRRRRGRLVPARARPARRARCPHERMTKRRRPFSPSTVNLAGGRRGSNRLGALWVRTVRVCSGLSGNEDERQQHQTAEIPEQPQRGGPAAPAEMVRAAACAAEGWREPAEGAGAGRETAGG